MKTTLVLPFLTYLTLISAAATPHAKRQIAPKPTTLSPSQIAALQSYTKPEATNPAMSAVNSALANAAINPSQLASQESAFRAAALATPKPAPPLYVGYMPEAQKNYLSSFYAAQASIIQKAGASPSPAPSASTETKSSTKTPAQILPDVTGSATTKPSSASSATPPSSVSTPPSSTPSSSSASSSQSSSTTLPSGSQSPSPTPSASSTPSGTASSSSSSKGAAAQPTAIAKAAGIGMGIVAGVAAFL